MKEAGPTIIVKNRSGSSKGNRCVRKIIKETKNTESGACTSFLTPLKESPRKSPLANLDDFNESLARRTFNDFYIVETETYPERSS
jgi:hypothetical protein